MNPTPSPIQPPPELPPQMSFAPPPAAPPVPHPAWQIALILAPIAVIVASIFAAGWLMSFAPKPSTVEPPKPPPPLVTAVPVVAGDLTLTVRTQGTVIAQGESAIVPEVAGRVTQVSPSLAIGEFVRANQELVWLDAADFELALANARHRMAQAKRALAMEQTESRIAVQEWRKLHGESEPPELLARKPQLVEAEAAVKAAEEAVRKAERDLRRTVIRAPYDGRVKAKQVDVGQYVSPTVTIARLYPTDAVEVRLPLAVDQLAYLDLPLSRADGRDEDVRRRMGNAGDDALTAAATGEPRVILTGTIGGVAHRWEGRIVRTEGEIDPQTRMLMAVARVERPFDPHPQFPGRPPLMVGLFVEAEIIGRHVREVVTIDRAAVHTGNQVHVVDEAGALRFRTVDILKAGTREVVVRAGFSPGDQVVISQLATAVDGMPVRVAAVGKTTPADEAANTGANEVGGRP